MAMKNGDRSERRAGKQKINSERIVIVGVKERGDVNGHA